MLCKHLLQESQGANCVQTPTSTARPSVGLATFEFQCGGYMSLFFDTLSVEPHTHVIIEFYLQRVLPEVGVVIVHVDLDRGTKKSLLVESFESLPVYFGIVSSRKDYFTLTVSCDLQNPLGA